MSFGVKKFTSEYYEQWQEVIDAGIEKTQETVPVTSNTWHQIWFVTRNEEPVGTVIARPFALPILGEDIDSSNPGLYGAEVGMRLWGEQRTAFFALERWIAYLLTLHPLLVAQCYPDNTRAIKAVRKVGFQPWMTGLDLEGSRVEFFRLTKEDFTPSRLKEQTWQTP